MKTPNPEKTRHLYWQLPLAVLLTLGLATGVYADTEAEDHELEVTLEIIESSDDIEAFEMKLDPPADELPDGNFFQLTDIEPTDGVPTDGTDGDGVDGEDGIEGGDVFHEEEQYASDHEEWVGDDAADEAEQVDDREVHEDGDAVADGDEVMDGDEVADGDEVMDGDEVADGDEVMNGDEVTDGDEVMDGDEVTDGEEVVDGDAVDV